MDNNLIKKTVKQDIFIRKEYKTDDYLYIGGYLAVYNIQDHQNDVLVNGLFDNVPKLLENGHKLSDDISCKPDDLSTTIPMLYNHDFNKRIGSWIKAESDKKGLYCVGKIDMRSPFGKEIAKKILGKKLQSLSVAFTLQGFQTKVVNGVKVRIITKASLCEGSVVDIGANQCAQIRSANYKYNGGKNE